MYCRALISATSEDEAYEISKSLVEKKLVAGTMITEGDCHYWWEGGVVEKPYWNVGAFSIADNKDQIIEEVKKLHSDECPIISFTEIDGNKEFLDWVSNSLEKS